ncbi:MAG TPA: hypothetical protein VF265_02145 [Nevskiaceae bacterium]
MAVGMLCVVMRFDRSRQRLVKGCLVCLATIGLAACSTLPNVSFWASNTYRAVPPIVTSACAYPFYECGGMYGLGSPWGFSNFYGPGYFHAVRLHHRAHAPRDHFQRLNHFHRPDAAYGMLSFHSGLPRTFQPGPVHADRGAMRSTLKPGAMGCGALRRWHRFGSTTGKR